MGNIALNWRGTSGSGKSFLANSFLKSFENSPILDSKGKIRGYKIFSNSKIKEDTYLLGKYTCVAGGCDTIPTQDEICDRIREWLPLGNVLYEGLLVSGLFRRYNELADSLPEHHFIFGFLDTPLEKCIEQTLARRAKKGNVKPFDPEKTLAPKFRAILSSREALEAAGKDCRDIPHGDAAFPIVVGWLST